MHLAPAASLSASGLASTNRCPTASTNNCVAVLGAAKRFTDRQLEAGYRLGAMVARVGRVLVTGATTGIPYAAAIGACDHGGAVFGISPAANAREHRHHYDKPTDFHHAIIYTGLGNDGRSPLIVRSASIALFVGGEAGTLQEFTAAWLNGTPVIGVLTGFGGISDQIPSLADTFTSHGSHLIKAAEPEELVEAACAALESAAIGNDTLANASGSDTVLQAIASLRPFRHVGFPPSEGAELHGVVVHRLQTGDQKPPAETSR